MRSPHLRPARHGRVPSHMAHRGLGAALASATAVAVMGASFTFSGPWPEASAAPHPEVAATNAAVQRSRPSCTLNLIGKVASETTAAIDQQTASWVLVQNENWSAWVPNEAWALDAGPQGADMHSPDDRSDASLAAYDAVPGQPYSLGQLYRQILGGVSNVHVICRTPVARNTTAETQGTELTGAYEREAVHVVIILSVYLASGNGEIRDFYTPASEWSAANARTLMLVLMRAIEVPQSLTP